MEEVEICLVEALAGRHGVFSERVVYLDDQPILAGSDRGPQPKRREGALVTAYIFAVKPNLSPIASALEDSPSQSARQLGIDVKILLIPSYSAVLIPLRVLFVPRRWDVDDSAPLHAPIPALSLAHALGIEGEFPKAV